MDEKYLDLDSLPSNLKPKDLAEALRRLDIQGEATNLPKGAMAQGRVGYNYPLSSDSDLILGLLGQMGIGNQVPTKTTGFDVGYATPTQSFSVGYSANPQMNSNDMVLGKHGWTAKYRRSF